MRARFFYAPLRRRAVLGGGVLTLASILSTAAPRVAAASPEETPAREQWYVISIAGRPVGSVHERLEVAGDGRLTSSTDFRLALNRMGSQVEMASSATFRESAQGRLEGGEVSLDVSDQATVVRARVTDDGLVIEQEAGGKSFSRTVPVAGELLGPEGVRRLSAVRLAEPGDEVSYQTFSPELAAVTGATRRVVARETVELAGRPTPALQVVESLAASPMKTTLWLDGEGYLLRSEVVSPFGAMTVTRAGAEEAARAAAGGELPEESYAGTLVHTQVRIPRARRLEELELELVHRRPELGWPDLAGPGQRVLEQSDDRLVLAVERRHPRGEHSFPVAVTEELRPYLEPNAYVQSDDPGLRAAARQIVAGRKELFAAALALQRWVAQNMSFDLGVVLAPSVEVFQNRRGTCTEYAVLLTTLARAVGIPARVVMGFVYLDGVFAGHAWTEVRAGEDWIPLDGAIVADGPADAARFAFQRSSLADGIGELSLGPGAQLFGQIDARVLAFQVAGEPRRTVSAGMELYTVTGEVYRNPGLGVTWTRPPGFDFVDLDEVWPEDTLAGLAGRGGELARLAVRPRLPWEDGDGAARRRLERLVPEGAAGRLEVDGHPALLAESPRRAALALPLGGEIWLLSVEADGAPELLRRLAAGLDL